MTITRSLFITIALFVTTTSYAQKKTFINDKKVEKTLIRGTAKLLKNKNLKQADFSKELVLRRCTLNLPKATSLKKMSAVEIYKQRRKTVVLIAQVIKAKKGKRKKLEIDGSGSGSIIHPDGVIMTSYHVVYPKPLPDDAEVELVATVVMTSDGKVFPIEKILAADKQNDVALLKIKTNKKLPYATLKKNEPVGSDVTLITHIDGRYYSLTKGYISRYNFDNEAKIELMTITADVAQGSSGGPVFNDHGAIIGVVFATTSIADTIEPDEEDSDSDDAEDDEDDAPPPFEHQMTIKECIPVKAVLGLIKSTK